MVTACVAAGAVFAAEREMNVRQGPDAVFDRPVSDIVPALAGAEPTAENGRVGSELVFWGYEHADGRRAFLFACALLPNVDCNERLQSICLTNTAVLETREVSGKIVRRRCQEVALASPGDSHPGCNDTEASADLLVGLVECG